MRYFKIFFVLTFISLLINECHAQGKLTFMVHGGVSIPTAALRGVFVLDDSTESSYFTKRGFNFGAEGKINFNRSGNYKLVFGLNYNGFRSSQNITVASSDTTSYTLTAIPKIHIITASAGMEYDFYPNDNINPYAGLDLTANFIGGSGFADTLSADGQLVSLPYHSETRIGLQLVLGVDIKLSDHIGIDAGFKYNIANLNKKAVQPAHISGGEIFLNDSGHINEKGSTVNSKTISYLQYQTGITFYF